MSYLVSIYRKEMKPVSFFDFALFLSFFPSVIAGPINRANEFMPQIQADSPRDVIDWHRAFMLIILAIIKVYWLSSFFSQAWVKPVFDNPSEFHTVSLFTWRLCVCRRDLPQFLGIHRSGHRYCTASGL